MDYDHKYFFEISFLFSKTEPMFSDFPSADFACVQKKAGGGGGGVGSGGPPPENFSF